MKHFYYLLILILITGCQQQQVPEIFYDLDAENMTHKTRAMEQLILYQAPLDMVINKEMQLFHGNVAYLETETKDKKRSIKVKVENEMQVVLEFEVEPEVAALMNLEMELAVRYMREHKKNSVVEIKKAAW
jgi:ferritin-like protein